MSIRGIFFIAFALFIDGMQAALAWTAFALGAAFQGITPLGGGLAGAAAGAAACWNSSGGIMQGVIEASKCISLGGAVGASASTFGVPLGIGLGMALEICISLTFGFGLIVLLWANKMYYPSRVGTGILIEMIPGFNAIPGWTAMVILCLIKKAAEEKQASESRVQRLAGTAMSIATSKPLQAARNTVVAARREQQMELPNAGNNKEAEGYTARLPLETRSPRIKNDITPRNSIRSNQPYVQAV